MVVRKMRRICFIPYEVCLQQSNLGIFRSNKILFEDVANLYWNVYKCILSEERDFLTPAFTPWLDIVASHSSGPCY